MYVREIVAQLDQVREFPRCPENLPGEGDHIVGTLTEDLKKLYALRDRASRQLESAARKLMHLRADVFGRPPNADQKKKLEDLLPEVTELKFNAEMLQKLFWTSVRKEFRGLVDKDVVSLYAGWQVGWSHSPANDLLEIIGLA
jgi:hypothetical protein